MRWKDKVKVTVQLSVSQSVYLDIKPHPRSLTRDAETRYIDLIMDIRVGQCWSGVELVLSTGKRPWPAVYLTVGARLSRAMVPSSWIKQCFLSPTLTSPCKVSWLGSILQLHSLWRWWLQCTPKLWHSNVKHGYSKAEITWTSLTQNIWSKIYKKQWISWPKVGYFIVH